MSNISRDKLESQLTDAVQQCKLLEQEAIFEPAVRCQLYQGYTNKQRECEMALQRLSHGQFGVCQRCGHEIEGDRLNTLPNTPYCSACAKSNQPTKPQRFR